MSPADDGIVAFTVRLPEDEHRKLVEIAKKEHRPLNAQVRLMLTEALTLAALRKAAA